MGLHHLHQWGPFQIAGLLQAWQISHLISRCSFPGGWLSELPLTTVVLQFLLYHLEPPWQAPSINLYSKCCSDYTISTLHMSKIVGEYDQEIPLSQTADNPMAPPGPAKPLFSKRCQGSWTQDLKLGLFTVLWSHPVTWYWRSIISWPCHCAASIEGSSWSMAKFRCHGAWHSIHKRWTHGHGFCKRSDWVFDMSNDRQQRKACHLGSKRKLPSPTHKSDSTELYSAVYLQYGSAVPLHCAHLISIRCQLFRPSSFQMQPVFATFALT